MTRIKHIKRITVSHNHRKCSSLQISFMHITSSGLSKVPEKLPEHTLVFFHTEKPRPRESTRHECPGAGLRWLWHPHSPSEPGLEFFLLISSPASCGVPPTSRNSGITPDTSSDTDHTDHR